MILMLMIDSRGIDFPGAEKEGITIISLNIIIIIVIIIMSVSNN